MNPAAIIAEHVRLAGHINTPGTGAVWPYYLGFKPDNPIEVVVLYNTRGKMDGRDMRTGAMFSHPGIMFMVRAADEYAAFAKVNQLKEFIDTVRRETVLLEDLSYRIDAITRTTDPIALGREAGNSPRMLYSLNAIATITAL